MVVSFFCRSSSILSAVRTGISYSYILLFFTLLLCPCKLGLGEAIQIDSIEELQKIGNDPLYPLDGNYELTQDIDASETISWNNGEGFAPIGGYDNPFVGTFDGKGFTIENLYISLPTVPGEENGGIFSIVGETGVIKDLSLENAYIGGGYRYMGGIAGINFGLIVGCSVRGSIVSNTGAGGLVGSNNGVILDSHFLGNVTGSGFVGGIAGANDGDYGRPATIENCYVLGKITLRGSSSAGGIAGWGRGGKVKNCY
ncbi:MAG: hypothetical protein N3G21_13690, partial [Candidatus Hydrogenedentes bacterium]|nr:hypothetical protein [Candidatus Hydrogenedentota bacterium]